MALARRHAADGQTAGSPWRCGSSAGTRGSSHRASGPRRVINDLRGSDPSQWRTQIPQFRDVVYPDLWPGIDLRLREQSGVLKYEFHVRPGASPSDIRLAYDGADGLALERRRRAADLHAARRRCGTPRRCRTRRSAAPQVPWPAATCSHGADDALLVRRRQLSSRSRTGHRPGRAVHDVPRRRQRTRPAPASRSTRAATPTSPARPSRRISRPRPARSAAPAPRRTSPTCSSPSSTPRARRSSTRPSSAAATWSSARGMAIDAAGNAYVTGTDQVVQLPDDRRTPSTAAQHPAELPALRRSTTPTGSSFKLNAAGSALVYSTYLGGTDIDSPRGIAVDGAGNAYVTGETLSLRLPHHGRRVRAAPALASTTCS